MKTKLKRPSASIMTELIARCGFAVMVTLFATFVIIAELSLLFIPLFKIVAEMLTPLALSVAVYNPIAAMVLVILVVLTLYASIIAINNIVMTLSFKILFEGLRKSFHKKYTPAFNYLEAEVMK